MFTIQKAVVLICDQNNLYTKDDLYRWCDGFLLWDVDEIGYARMYELVELQAPEHWKRLKNPQGGVRAKLQTILTGYKRFTSRTPTTTPVRRAENLLHLAAEHDSALESVNVAQKRVDGLREALRIAEVEAATKIQQLKKLTVVV